MNELANEYAYATECNLATLDELVMLKSSSKARIRRQKSICARMLRVCQQYAAEIDWGGQWKPYGRVRGLLDAAGTSGSIDATMDAHIAALED